MRICFDENPPTRRKRVKLPPWGDKKAGLLDLPDDIAHRAQDQADFQAFKGLSWINLALPQ
jgi:hypothetical protein